MPALLPKVPRALVRLDDIVITRPSPNVDSEGNAQANSVVFTGKGTLSQAGQRDVDYAGTRGTTVDSVLAVERTLDLQAGDLVTVEGQLYEVVAVDNRRLYRRGLVRAVIS